MRKRLTPFWLLFILTGLNLLNYLDRFVLNAVRTPLGRGKANGALHGEHPVDLAAETLRAVTERTGD